MTTDPPPVLLAIPVKNGETYIRRWLRNVGDVGDAYGRRNMGLCLYEGDSADRTVQIVGDWLKSQEGWRRIVWRVGVGQGARHNYSTPSGVRLGKIPELRRLRNLLLKEAEPGEWVLCWDSDIANVDPDSLTQAVALNKPILGWRIDIPGSGNIDWFEDGPSQGYHRFPYHRESNNPDYLGPIKCCGMTYLIRPDVIAAGVNYDCHPDTIYNHGSDPGLQEVCCGENNDLGLNAWEKGFEVWGSGALTGTHLQWSRHWDPTTAAGAKKLRKKGVIFI